MKHNLDKYDSTGIHWVSDEELLMAILPKKVYIVSAHGWYYGLNYYSIHNTFDEALKALGFSSKEEYEKYNKSFYKEKEGFWGYSIDEIDTAELYEGIKSWTQEKACYNKADEIAERSQNIINSIASHKIEAFRKEMEGYAKEWIKENT